MKTQIFTRILSILLFVVAVCLPAASQTPQLNQPMPLDPAITMGKFPNGLRYYILRNKKPEKRAELRLVIKAGSVLEDPDQRGSARTHFLAATHNIVGRGRLDQTLSAWQPCVFATLLRLYHTGCSASLRNKKSRNTLTRLEARISSG